MYYSGKILKNIKFLKIHFQCIAQDPCFVDGDPNGTPHCQNTDGSPQTCVNTNSCEGLGLNFQAGGSCPIQCIEPNPCYVGGDENGTPWCQNTDGTEQTCMNTANCVGKSTLEADGSGTCVIGCVIPDPCYVDGDPNGTPHCVNTDGSEQTCTNASNCEGLSTIQAGGSCSITCVTQDPCYQGGDPNGNAWCTNDDGSEQNCNNPGNCVGKATFEADGSGSCSVTCDVEDPCFLEGTTTTPLCTNTDGSAANCNNNGCVGTDINDPNDPGSCVITCEELDPCFDNGLATGTPNCQNTDGSPQTCNNPGNCIGLATQQGKL